jgi:thioredoxin 1
MAENTLTVDDASFPTQVLEAKGPVLVDFWNDGCGPCRMIAPMLEEIATEFKDKLTVVKVNIGANPEAPRQFNVRGAPTLILFKDGKPAATRVGGASKSALKDWVQKSL